MNSKHFRDTHQEIPKHNCMCEWKSYAGYIDVFYLDGNWYTMGWKPLPDGVVIKWREKADPA